MELAQRTKSGIISSLCSVAGDLRVYLLRKNREMWNEKCLFKSARYSKPRPSRVWNTSKANFPLPRSDRERRHSCVLLRFIRPTLEYMFNHSFNWIMYLFRETSTFCSLLHLPDLSFLFPTHPHHFLHHFSFYRSCGSRPEADVLASRQMLNIEMNKLYIL